MADQWRTYPPESPDGGLRLDGGLNLSRNPALLGETEASDALNVEHDLNSAKLTGGAIKFNNQVARKPGILLRPDPALTPLSIEAGRSVPVRTYGYIPYSESMDIGGDFATVSGSPPSEVIHTRRGQSFNFEVSFKVPEDVKLYRDRTDGANSPDLASDDDWVAEAFGYDQGIDDTFLILQKGGDRLSALSWFLGVMNVGGETRDGGQNLYEIITGYPADEDRVSNYCLVFGWYDSGGWAQPGQTNMRYDLTTPSAAATGEYSTQSLRAVTIPHWVEPGREYHVAVKMKMDTADVSDSSWNNDGLFQVAVSEGLGPAQVYGFSGRNYIDYSEDLEKGLQAQSPDRWTLDPFTDSALAKVEVTGPTGARFTNLLSSEPIATDPAILFYEEDQVWGAAPAGQVWVLSFKVREETSQFVRPEIVNFTDSSIYGADFEWQDGNLVLRVKDTGLDSATAHKIKGTDWWEIQLVRTLEAADAFDTWRIYIYTAYQETAGVPDKNNEVAGQGIYLDHFQFEEIPSMSPSIASPYEPNYGAHAYKGPQDSLEYLIKYGIRYSSRDPVYVGLGYRTAPWTDYGFIPFGADGAPLEHGGFCLPDRSIEDETTLYSSYTLQFARTANTNGYLTLTERSFTDGRSTEEAQSPTGPTGVTWKGYNDVDAVDPRPNTDFNAESLRGYRVVLMASADAAFRGAVFTISNYQETATVNRVNIQHGSSSFPKGGTFTAVDGLVQAFRWNQRPLVISEVRFYSVRDDMNPSATVSPAPDSSGNTSRDYTPSEVTSSHARHRLSVFYPRPEVPRPAGGYPVLVKYETASHFTEADPAANIAQASDFYEWSMLKEGWVVISVGTTGTDSSGSATIGAFSKFGSARWDDYTEFFPHKDAVWARQWIAENATALGINNDMVILSGDESAGEIAIYAAGGADRAQESGSSQVQQSTKSYGIVAREARSWYRAFDLTGSGSPWLDDAGARASTIGDASINQINASSPSRVVREADALSSTTTFFLSYDETAESTDTTRAANGDPTLSDTITALNRAYWFGLILRQDLLGVSTSLHGVYSRLAVQSGLELASPNNLETDTFTGVTTGPIHAGLAGIWTTAEIPYPTSRVERDYHDARTQFSLRSEALLSDELEPGIESLRARYPMDDGGGGVLVDTVSGHDGYVAPFSLGVSRNGTRGRSQLFLSGEGEALQIDLGESPVFRREFERMQRSESQGFAIEISCIFPEAFYAVDDNIGPGLERLAKFAPHIATWEVADPANEETNSDAQLLLGLTSNLFWNTTSTAPTNRPVGFQPILGAGSDQQNDGLTRNYVPIHNAAQPVPFTWNEDARWVGKRVTLQVGVQSDGSADTYTVYIAGSSARDLLGEDSSATLGDRDFVLYSSNNRIEKKDLLRSVVTIGGCWDVASLANGYTEANCRMIVDEVRIFGSAAPGPLPADTLSTNYPVISGGLVTDNDGKLSGPKSYPDRKLTIEDILQPLGEGVVTANLLDGSSVITAAGREQFYEAEPEDDIRSVKETYLVVPGDPFEKLDEESIGEQIPEFYRISDVAAGGATLTIDTPFADITRNDAGARSMRILAYTSFDDDIRDKPLPLGRGAAYDPASATTDDATLTEDYFTNIAPVGVNWRFRVFSPIPASSVRTIRSAWVRGLQSPRRNEILGLHHVNKRVIAGSRGSLFEVDDRWREDGPTDDYDKALEFRSTRASSGVLLPRETDRLVFSDASNVELDAAALNGVVRIFDAYVRRRDSGLYQTVMWVGSEDTDPQHDDANHKLHLWIRLRDGFPQICLKSTATYDGTNIPPGGLFFSEGQRRLPLDEWVHVRWYLFTNTSGTIIEQPHLQVGGKTATSRVNNVEDGLSGDNWLTTASLVSSGDEGRVVLGVARDAYIRTETDIDFEQDEFKGLCKRPEVTTGYMHSLGGDLARVAVVDSTTLVAPPSDFDPATLDYSLPPYSSTAFLAGLQEGVGHKAEDTAGSQFGVIHSHPFISLFHEMGRGSERMSFASFGNEVFVANGGRVVVEEEGSARFAGVPTPSAGPEFELKRSPLWIPNSQALDPEDNEDTGISVAGTNGPVGAASIDDDALLYHYSTRGNRYLRQESHAEMRWEKKGEIAPDATELQSFFFVKMYFRVRSVSGRILIWSQKADLRSGKSIEIRDGKIGLYWYDTELKKEVGVLTNEQVVKPGKVYYLYVRKGFPKQWNRGSPDPTEIHGNYLQSYFTNGATYQITATAGITGTWVVGETFDDDAGATKIGRILRVSQAHEDDSSVIIEYLATGVAFVGTENITGNTSGATATNVSAPILVARDNFVLREFPQSAPTTAWGTNTPYDAKTDGTTKNCVGFPTTTVKAASETTATGLVTPDPSFSPYTFMGSDGGIIDCSHQLFHADMVGMIFQWGNAAPTSVKGVVYRIQTVNSTTRITVVPEDGTSPTNFGTISASSDGSGVFSGVALIKSEDFDESKAPDLTEYDVALAGSPLQGSPETGISPFDGEVWCPGWGTASTVGTNAFAFFEGASGTDYIETGTDEFDDAIYVNTGTPGPLFYDAGNGRVFTAIDPEKTPASNYVTTQPNADLSVDPDEAESSLNAKALIWESVSEATLLEGTTRVYVTYYDPDNDLEGNPSPVLTVRPGGDDDENASGDIVVGLTSIPIRPGFWRRVYMTLIDGADAFRVGEIPDDTSSSYAISKTQTEITQGFPLRFDRGEPPRCKIVAESQAQMFYGNLEGQPDGVIYSRPFDPHAVPRAYTLNGALVPAAFVIDTGDDTAITGLHDLKGRLVAFKRNIAKGVFASNGVVTIQDISDGAGCVSQQSISSLDDQLYWCDTRGPMFFGGTGVPMYLGTKLERYFDQVMDPDYLSRISSAINRRRNQYVFTSKREDSDYTHERLAFEFDHQMSGAYVQHKRPAMHRITRSQSPNITALVEVDSRTGGPRRLVGGSEEGFLFWLDRNDVTSAGMGTTSGVHGARSLIAGRYSSPLAVFTSTALDQDLEGPRGVWLRWRHDDADQGAVVLYVTSGGLGVERPLATSPPAEGDVFTLGSLLYLWRSKHFSFATSAQRKKPYYLDVTRVADGGTLYVDVFKDHSTTPVEFEGGLTLDLATPVGELDIGQAQFARYFQVRFSTRADQVDVAPELLEMLFRLAETEPR